MALTTVKIQGVGLVSTLGAQARMTWFLSPSLRMLGCILRQAFSRGSERVTAAPAITPSLPQP